MSIKHAVTDHPILELLRRRWSPYAFADRDVSADDLRALFEAARWAPSSYNEQPWSYLVALRSNAEAFERLLSCLVEANQVWARRAPLLALGILKETFALDGRPNPAARHDLGLAAGSLLAEATARGLAVHQMIGILPERARELYAIPEDWAALTALAIGYVGDPASLPEALRERDLAPRARKPLADFVFGGRWGETSGLVSPSTRER